MAARVTLTRRTLVVLVAASVSALLAALGAFFGRQGWAE